MVTIMPKQLKPTKKKHAKITGRSPFCVIQKCFILAFCLPSFHEKNVKKIGHAAVHTSMRNCVLFKKTLQLAPCSRQQGPTERMGTFGLAPTKFRPISSNQGHPKYRLVPTNIFLYSGGPVQQSWLCTFQVRTVLTYCVPRVRLAALGQNWHCAMVVEIQG